MGFFGSSKVMNEENYLLQKLARRYGTNNVDNCTRMCHASTVWALRTSLGAGAMTNSMRDLREEADVFWIQGRTPASNIRSLTASTSARPSSRGDRHSGRPAREQDDAIVPDRRHRPSPAPAVESRH